MGRAMVRFILYRLLRAGITLLLFQTLLFLMLQAMPGDFVKTLTGLPPPLRRGLQPVMGLNDPLWKQYFRLMRDFATGHLGTTFRFPHQSVGRILWSLAPRTLFLFLPASVLSIGLGYWLGRYLGGRRRPWDGVSLTFTGGAIVAATLFPPWVAFLLVQIFALRLGWFPAENVLGTSRWIGVVVPADTVILWLLGTGVLMAGALYLLGHVTRWHRHRTCLRRVGAVALIGGAVLAWHLSGWGLLALDLLWHLALPLITVVLLSFGEPMLLMRLAMLQVADEDYVRAARAKGLPPRAVRDHHMARLALVPVLARFLIQLPFVMLGSLVVELAFFWKGIGRELLIAIDAHDIPVVMGIFSVVGTLMLLAHVLLDILHAWLDPRVRTAIGSGMER
jgi:ABC-type dipeptide/oligopeptide/nickel transport systems, permease components